MTKQYCSQTELHKKILEGVDILADNVASTLGPRGRNVILQQKGKRPITTKDGVTVARFVELDDPMQNVGAQILKQASEQTNSKAGDGTTTSTVLARAILKQAQRYLIAGVSPIELKRGIDKAVEAVVERLKDMARPITSEEDIAHIATISANGDQTIGKLISMAVDQAGKDGAISIEEARSLETSLDVVEGFIFDSGYLASAFVTDERRGAVVYDDPLLLVTDHKIEHVEDVLPILEIVARESRPFIIVAENVEGQALAALIMNAARGTMKVAAIKAPRYGEERRAMLHDLALSTGATCVSRISGMKLRDVKLENLGSATKIESYKNRTTIAGGKGDWEQIEERIETYKEELNQTESIHECERIQERITKLASGIAIIRVGAATEIEMIEKKHRIEDALEAVKSAQLEGIVPGGGTALLRAVQGLDVDVENEDQRLGVEIVKKAVEDPIRQMAKNAGTSPDIVVSSVEQESFGYGWDFANNALTNLLEDGIIDPVKVTRCALQNAASVAAALITSNHAIVEE